nr:helix-turn-helix domain-containing protein [uncultured Microbacterium sp.]
MSESSFGMHLRDLRLSADMTLESLAERSLVSDRTISDIERGVSVSPRRATLDALATALGLDATQRQMFLRAARANRKSLARGIEGASPLPLRVNDFTGREREVVAVVEALGRTYDNAVAPVIALTGAPGLGKTTIAWEALSRTQDSYASLLFVDLDGFSAIPFTPLQVMTSLLRQMPGSEQKAPLNLPDAITAWREATAENKVAVLLDNASQEAQVRPVMAAGSGSAIVVTSRRSLSGLEGISRVVLGPLSADESVVLLSRLIAPAQNDDGSLAELAALCDHVPLALRVLGNRIASRPARRTSDFLPRLRSEESRLRTLVAGDLGVEAAFSLSYDELEPHTAELFRAIAVIDGGTFDARLATAVYPWVPSSADLIESLLEDLTDLGLLEARGGDRYRMHDLVRLFALARLREQIGDEGVDRRRSMMRNWLLRSLERAGAWFEPSRSPDASDTDVLAFTDRDDASSWIRAETLHWWPALRRAAAEGEHERVVDVADALHWFSDAWITWGHWHELFSLGAAAAQARGDDRMHATHLGYMAWADIVESGNDRGAIVTAQHAASIAERIGDSTQRGWAYFYISWALWRLDECEDAMAAVETSIDAFHAAGEDEGLSQAIVLMAVIRGQRGEHAEAIEDLLAVLERVGADREDENEFASKIAESATYLFLATAYIETGQALEAIDAATSGLAVARELGDDTRAALLLRRRIRAHVLAGDPEKAEQDIAEVLELIRPASEDAFMLKKLRDELGAQTGSGS